MRALVGSLEGIHQELVALRTNMERGGGSEGVTGQHTRAFLTSVPSRERPERKDVVPMDLEGSMVAYQEAEARLREALGREPDELEIVREVERAS